MFRWGWILVPVLALTALVGGLQAADDPYSELQVKREAVYGFAQKPVVSRDGDRTTIAFETRGFCDVAVTIEQEPSADGKPGRIIRHLAAGVLGNNAPTPFASNAKRQAIVWDGKDDQGRYVDDLSGLQVRVSLGLNPQMERTLNWSPHKRIGAYAPSLAAAPEGVYVIDGLGVDHLRLFNHDGDYIRTVYPFPREKLEQVQGLDRRKFEQDGQVLPVKHGFVQGSLLSSGTSGMDSELKHRGGWAASTMAVANGRIALAQYYVNRLTTDGTSGGLDLRGPKIGHRRDVDGRNKNVMIFPSSAAMSPDGKFVYLTGYLYTQVYPHGSFAYQGVYRVPFDAAADAEPEVFAGEMTLDGDGSDAAHFSVPTSVDTDAKGRVYVSDLLNNRIQVFAPDGKLVHSLKTELPAKVQVHRKTGEIYVFTWPTAGPTNQQIQAHKINWREYKARMTRYGPIENPKKLGEWPMPEVQTSGGMVHVGAARHVALDSWSERPRFWIVGQKHHVSSFEVLYWGGGTLEKEAADAWASDQIRIFELDADGKEWKLVHDFGENVKKDVVRAKPADFGRKRVYFNYADGKLYIAEDSGFGKSFMQLLQLDPESGKIRPVTLPFDAEDICFDLDGRAYLRTDTLVARYDTKTWREVPWDYGEEQENVMFSSIGGGKRANVIGGLRTPGHRPVCWHQGGMSINTLGQLAVSCVSREKGVENRGVKFRQGEILGKPYVPALWPGRTRWQEVHIWDKHGREVHTDAAPGTTQLGGCEIDREGNLYLLVDSTRAFGGEKYYNEMTGTLMKFQPGKGRVISAGGVIPLPDSNRPSRPPELKGGTTGTAWVEGADWIFGGVGWFGFNTARAGGGCDCWHSRFQLDLLARSFVPEVDRYSVAVLDKAGNVICRIGRYGNVDDGRPLVADNGPAATRPIGGDEVAISHAAYVGVHTDRRLFIYDAGNARIAAVKLGYHSTESVKLEGK